MMSRQIPHKVNIGYVITEFSLTNILKVEIILNRSNTDKTILATSHPVSFIKGILDLRKISCQQSRFPVGNSHTPMA